MKTSETIDLLAAALVEFQKKVGKVAKTSKNPFFGSKYAALHTILDAIAVPLQETGLAIVQLPSGTFGLTTRLIHQSGQWIEESYTMQPTKTAEKKGQPVEEWQVSPQTMGSAITYQRRYAIGALLCLNIDDDDDGNSASGTGERTPATPLNDDTRF